MPAVACGAELLKRLKASGTPAERLAPGRELLLRVHESEGRVAAAGEVCEVLARVLGPDNGTTRKARAIMESGEHRAANPAEVPAEELVLAAQAKKAAVESAADDDGGKADAKPPRPAAKKPEAPKG